METADARTSSLTDVRNSITPTSINRPPHLKALTSVRALAALYVGVYHMVRPFDLWGHLAIFMSAGYSAVSFFFFLSGFIMVYTHGPEFAAGKGDTKRFLIARFARIYPLYLLISLIVGMLEYRAMLHPTYHVVAYLAQIFMVQSWHIRLTPFFNIVAWSVSEEAFFYCCFPFVALHLRPRSLRHGLSLLLGCYVLAILPGLVMMHFDPAACWREFAGSGDHRMVYFVRRFPPLLLPQFLCGVVAGWIYLQTSISRTFGQLALLAGGGVLTVANLGSDHLPYVLLHNGLLIPAYVLLLYGLSRPNIVTKVLSWTPFVLAGEASYAFYLTHFVFSDWTASVLHWHTTIGGLVPRLAVLFPLSFALHWYVERPARRWIIRQWDARAAAISAL